MEYVDVASIGGLLALFLGLLMLVGGLYARRRGRFRTRHGAAVLAGFSAVMGATFMAIALITFVRA